MLVQVNLDPRMKDAIFTKFSPLTTITIVIKPQERLGEVDCFGLGQAPAGWSKFLEIRSQIFAARPLDIIDSVGWIAIHTMSR